MREGATMDGGGHHDDIGHLIAGAFGGLVRWLRSPDGLRGMIGAVIAGSFFGYGIDRYLAWQRPDVPADFRLFAAFVVGIVSGLLTEFAMRKVDAVLKKLQDEAKSGNSAPAPAPGIDPGAKPGP